MYHNSTLSLKRQMYSQVLQLYPLSKAEYSETNTYFMFNNIFVYENVLAFKRLFAKKNFE
jgi:hypothetical protein